MENPVGPWTGAGCISSKFKDDDQEEMNEDLVIRYIAVESLYKFIFQPLTLVWHLMNVLDRSNTQKN